MDLGKGLGHLTYSTLVHPGDTWEDMWTSLTTYVPQVQKRVCPTAPFGVSLRLSNASATTLVKSKPERDKLKSFLADNNMYLYTVNAFPYGPFKNQIVKEQVYEPDWRSEERTQYTMNVAEILADVVPASISPSIQSAPLGFKPNVTGKAVIDSYTEHVMRVAARLIDLEKRTGRTVTLALEPEPFCFLETTDETVDYFTNHLYTGKSAEMLAKLAGLPISEAIIAQRKFIGTVFDICHQAVVYEDIAASLQKLVDAGIPIFKLQEAAAHAHAERDAEDRRHAQALRQDDLSHADRREEGRQAQPLPQSRGRLQGLGERIPARANGARTSTCRCSSTISASSAPRASRSRTR